ncbi:hypothetical protein [Eikenella sp. NML03-A-027]|uniref:hypothetical protein n=1 Tax=Eikenella sp. NML03-A-027 TaxID=1795828 RepID=UPI0012E7204E|nr:hypothetical protein [Eikenella sp. NML03-A-027]
MVIISPPQYEGYLKFQVAFMYHPLCPTLFPNNTLPSPRIQFSPNPLYNAVIPISI